MQKDKVIGGFVSGRPLGYNRPCNAINYGTSIIKRGNNQL